MAMSTCSGPITESAGTDNIGGFGTTLIENDPDAGRLLATLAAKDESVGLGAS